MKKYNKIILSLIATLALSTSAHAIDIDCTHATGIPEVEYDALESLYNSRDGDNWINNSIWGIVER